MSVDCMDVFGERGPYALVISPFRETDVPNARWVRGHEKMISLMWTAGKVESVPENLAIIDGHIQPELEYVGVIEKCCYVGFMLREDHLEAFEIVVTFPLTQTDISGPEEFVNALLSIYAIPPYISKNYPGSKVI